MMSSTPVSALLRRTSVVLMLGACLLAHAEPFQYVTPQVSIDFDTDGFAFSRDTTAFGGLMTEDIAPNLVSFSQAGNGVQIDFNGLMSVYASSYSNFSSQTLAGYFNAAFNFTPQAGYAITGYTVTLAGTYSVETPGSVSAYLPGVTWFGQVGGGGAFSESGALAGGTSASINGTIGATGDITSVFVFDGYDTYIDHYESVLDYCEDVEPYTCYFRDEPVYVSVPLYHEETDLGEASIDLRTITVQANVIAVPEPGALALLLAGLPAVGWWARRRRQA